MLGKNFASTKLKDWPGYTTEPSISNRVRRPWKKKNRQAWIASSKWSKAVNFAQKLIELDHISLVFYSFTSCLYIYIYYVVFVIYLSYFSEIEYSNKSLLRCHNGSIEYLVPSTIGIARVCVVRENAAIKKIVLNMMNLLP